jgi:hypothetical protein
LAQGGALLAPRPHQNPGRQFRIKAKAALTILFVLVGFCGCVHEYLLHLKDGDEILSLDRPKLQGTNYYFTDPTGTKCVIPQYRVVKIRAASVVSEDGKPTTQPKPAKPKHWYFLWLA